MSNLCECGCGTEVPGGRFVHGHNRRGKASFTSNGRWSMKYDCCRECGTTELKHTRDGYCRNCYRRKARSGEIVIKRDLTGGKWSKKYDCCTECGTTEVRYKSKGRCEHCVAKKQVRDRGKRNRNFGGWSWYYDRCVKCGTSEIPHGSRGLCMQCYSELGREDKKGDLARCPVCGVATVRLEQHLAMKSKRSLEHRGLYNKLYDSAVEAFSSSQTSREVALSFGVSKRRILDIWHENFTKEEVVARGEKIRISKISGENHYLFGTLISFPYSSIIRFEDIKGKVVFLRSSWEEKYARYLDSQRVEWEYETYKFKYYDSEGSPHYYFPDFYLPGTGEFVEVKGYMTDKDQYKMDECKRIHGINIRLMQKEDFRVIGIVVY